MKKLLLKTLLPFLGTVIRPVVETVEDETGYYLKLKLYVLGRKVWSGRVYLKRDTNGIIPNQKIEL